MDKEKHVDESWKEAVSKEKESDPLQTPSAQEKDATETEGESDLLEVNFLNYIASLAFQAMIFLGDVPNPMNDNKIDKNLKQAKFLIDTLVLLREKTKGNLDKQEEEILNASIYELQMKYVEHSKEETSK